MRFWILLSQSPQAGQFNSYVDAYYSREFWVQKSQSPQAGQFNSYLEKASSSNTKAELGLNPLKRVNSILTYRSKTMAIKEILESQSPQAGQFNSYLGECRKMIDNNFHSLNPLKRVNSILT